jgi:putative component of membrane protein insertase Oxa1/YidC/SpoIIIJ protein YidD
MKYLPFVVIGVILLSSITAQSQLAYDMMLIIKYNPQDSPGDSADNMKSLVIIPTKPEELVRMSIKFYQYFISSQDLPSCVFTPSCSRFAEQSIYYFGFIKGILVTSDRLQRCHAFGDKFYWYTFNFNTERFNDPVDRYGEIK